MSSIFDEASRRAGEAASRADKARDTQADVRAANDEILALARSKIGTLNSQVPQLHEHLRRQGARFTISVVEFREIRQRFRSPEVRQIPICGGWRLVNHAAEDMIRYRSSAAAARRFYGLGLVLLDSGEVHEYSTLGAQPQDPGQPPAQLIRRYDIGADLPPEYLDSGAVTNDQLTVGYKFEVQGVPRLETNYQPIPKISGIEIYSRKFADLISRHNQKANNQVQIFPAEGLRVHAWADAYEDALIRLAGVEGDQSPARWFR